MRHSLCSCSRAAAALIATLVAACSVPTVDYSTGDGGDGPAPLALLVPSTTTVVEGEQTSFTVAPSERPDGPIDVALASSDGNRLGVMPPTLHFDGDAWAAQTVTITGKQDLDTEEEAVAIAITSGIGDADVAVTIQDDDVLRIVALPAGGLDVTEARSASLTVKLGAQPTGPVTVTVRSSDTSLATASPAELRFDVDDWDREKTVVVSGTDDDDTVSEDGVVTLSAPSLAAVPVSIHVTDDDDLILLPSMTNLGSITEGGTATFTVTLSRQPLADVAVAVASSDSTAATALPTALTFRPSTWNTPQPITVTLPEDDDAHPDAATITLSAATLTSRAIAVAVVDDDVQAILATPSPVMLVEGGGRSLAVRLAYRPTADLTVAVTSLDPTAASAMPPMLTFTPALFDQPQTVTIDALADDDPLDDATTIHLESILDTLTYDVPVAITDDDQLLIEPTTTQVTLTETGTATFDVRLTAMPSADVTVNVSSGDGTAAAVSPSTLSFPLATWSTPRTVTVTGVRDLDLATDAVTITLAASPIPPAQVTATVTDLDVQTVIVTPTALSVNEGGTGTATVRLGFVPNADTTVTLTSADSTVATVAPASVTFNAMNSATPRTITFTGLDDADAADETTTITATAGAATAPIAVTVNDDDPLGIATDVTTMTVGEAGMQTLRVRLTAAPSGPVMVTVMSSDLGAATVTPATLSFDALNWGTYKDVVVRGVDDADPANESVTLTVAATSFTPRTVTVTVADDDPQGIVVSAAAVSLTEIGSATVSVRLAAMPPGDVTVTITSADITHAVATPATLTFNAGNFGGNQTVTITGVHDADLASGTVAINLTAPPIPARTVIATVTDVDSQVVQALQTGTITLTEGGSATASFRLGYPPTGTVVVTVTSGSSGLGVTPGTLSFDATNFDTYRPVTLTGLQDDNAANLATAITATPPTGAAATVNVAVVDDDVLGIEPTYTTLTIGEGASFLVGVKLTAEPPGTATVTIASSDGGAATALPAMLTFTPGTWSTNQYVTIAGAQDLDINDEGVTVTLSSPPMPPRTIGVTVDDEDVVAIALSTTAITIDEPGTGTLGVSLAYQPNAPVTVTLTSNDAGAAMVTGTVSFTTMDWSTPKNVTVTGIADADAANETVTITLSSPVTLDRTVAVTVIDDDLTLSDLSVQMGSAAGGTAVTAIGAGFTAATTIALGGRALTGQTVASSTQLTGTTQSNTRWADAVATKGTVTATVPRAFYHGAWEPAVNGVWGGTIYSLVAAGATNVYATTRSGVVRSTDGGASWIASSGGQPVTGELSKLAVDPQNPMRLYWSGSNGIHVSTDGALTWTRAGNLTQGTSCVAVAPSSPSTILACGYNGMHRSTNSGATWSTIPGLESPSHVAFSTQDANVAMVSAGTGVYKTVDGGVTWSQVFPIQAYTVAIDPTNAAIAYAATASGLLKTANGGTSWSPANSGLPGTPYVIVIHPSTPSTLYTTSYAGVYRSTDSGASWSPVSTGIPATAQRIYSLALRPSNPSELYAGTIDWGVFRSTNAASTWTRSTTGIAAYAIDALAAHPTITGTVFMAAEWMGLWKSTDHGVTWTSSSLGLPDSPSHTPAAIAFMPGTPSTMYVGMNGYDTSVYQSIDSGASWNAASTGLPTGLRVLDLAVDPGAPAIVYAATPSGVYKSSNAGGTWAAANTGLSELYAVSIAWSSTGVYVVSGNVLYRSTDGAASWSWAGIGLPSYTSGVVTDPTSTVVYAQSSSETYRSTNAGVSWSLVATGTWGLAIDPTRSSTVYAAGSNATPELRRSLTGLATLVGFGTGIPPQPSSLTVSGLVAVDRTGGTVYAATTGRGLWRLSP